MAQGADVIVAHQKGSVWNTPVACNVANAGLLLNNWTMGNGLGPLVYSESLTGSGGRSNAMRGLNKLNADISTELRYTGLEHLLAMIMGIAGVPTTVDVGGRLHTFQLANNVDGLFDTVVVQKNGPTASPALPNWEYPSVKWGGATFTFTADGLATMSVPAIASSCKPLTGQLAANLNLTPVTYRTKAHNCFGTHVKYRARVVPPTGDTALTDTDRFYPSQITLTFTRNLDSAYVMDGSGVQPEPYYTTFFEVGISIQFPVYGAGTLQANNTFLQAAFSETPMKMDITCTSPLIIPGATTEHYSLVFEFPNVVIGDTQMPVNDAGVIGQTVEMAALAAIVAPAGMTGLTQHFRIKNTSALSTDALAAP